MVKTCKNEHVLPADPAPFNLPWLRRALLCRQRALSPSHRAGAFVSPPRTTGWPSYQQIANNATLGSGSPAFRFSQTRLPSKMHLPPVQSASMTVPPPHQCLVDRFLNTLKHQLRSHSPPPQKPLPPPQGMEVIISLRSTLNLPLSLR